MELLQPSPMNWHLHEYDEDHLRTLLSGQDMFVVDWVNHPQKPFQFGTSRRYYDPDSKRYLPYGMFFAIPSDPVEAYFFFRGWQLSENKNDLLKNNVTETIYTLFRWMLDHFRHGPNQHPVYGLPFPVHEMFIRTKPQDPKGFYAYYGCQGAAAFVHWILRICNIPSIPFKVWLSHSSEPDSGTHSGIKFPSVDIVTEHLDNFYGASAREALLLDPVIHPARIFLQWKEFEKIYYNGYGLDINREHNRRLFETAFGKIRGNFLSPEPTTPLVADVWFHDDLGANSQLYMMLQNTPYLYTEGQAVYFQKEIIKYIRSQKWQGISPFPYAKKGSDYKTEYEKWEAQR